MPLVPRPLLVAFGSSLLLHALPLLGVLLAPATQAQKPPPAQLHAALTPQPVAPPPLELNEPPPTTPARSTAKPEKKSPAKSVDRKTAAKTWTRAIGEQFARQQQQGLFYPEEAIKQGLQGEVLVLLIIAPDGRVSAARVEQSSGHAQLDAAALSAVRRLHSLPADAPQEALLPVRFRLR